MAERQQLRRTAAPLKKGVARIKREREEFLRGLTKPARSRLRKRRPKK
jgi:hypothetical protein